jgi:hypothetical protein
MNKLTIGSFKREGEVGSFGHYFTHTLEDGREVCLESCLEGYCVAIYEVDGEHHNIVGEKTCTRIEIASGFSILSGEALLKAVEIANKKLGYG